jgi:hypothetical protein
MMGSGSKKDEVKDEPGAEERFDRIIKRALTTPPKHKKKARPNKSGPANPSKDGQK